MSLLRPLSSTFRAVAARPTLGGTSRPAIAIPAAHAATDPSSSSSSSPLFAATTIRSKHSATQVKRLFKNNPARLRILKKKGNHPGDKKPIFPDRVFPAIFKPTFNGEGWSAPPPPEVQVPDYPFRVARTGNKPFGAVGFLPVYRDIRIHGTKHTTIVRNVAGDVPAFLDELRAVLELPLGKKGILTSESTGKHGGGEAGRGVNRENPIRIRTGGAIEINGDHAREVKRWLAGLGF